jgi:hypothetical protein
MLGLLAVTLALILAALLVLSFALTGPSWVTALAVGLLFLNAGVLATMAGAPSPTPMLPYVLLLLPALYQLLVNRAPVVWGWPMTALLVFALVATLSTVVSFRPGDSFPTLVQWLLEGLVFFFAATNSIRTPAALRRCVQAVVAAGALVGFFVALQQHRGDFYDTFYGLAQVAAPYDITGASSVLADDVAGGQFRAAGMIGEPNFFAMEMVALTPWAAYLAVTARSALSRVAWLVSGLLLAYAVFVSYSRGALVAAGAVVVLMALCGVLPRRTLAYLAVAGTVAVAAVPTLAARLATLGAVVGGGSGEEASAAGRLSEVQAAWDVFASHPFVGVGPGQFPLYYQRYVALTGGSVHSGDGARNAHNIVLGLAADVGLVGLASFVALVWVVIARLVRARRDPSTRGVTSAALVSVCLYLGCSAFLHLAYARYLWLYLALATAASGLGSSRATEEPRPTLLPATLSGPSGPPSGAPQAGLVSR